RRDVEGDRRNCRRGIIADSRQGSELGESGRKISTVLLDDSAGTGVQVASAGVITQPLPEVQHLIERGGRQGGNNGPARHESVKIGTDGSNRGLLQHDLAEPDAVRVGALVGGSAPGENAAMPVIPFQKRPGLWR